ncbi:MAG: proteasome assembly chaperone family protein [DPANN group archaeon]|nr:proteasome assembly chaperone family protein [DPANN group archaeon]
MEIKLKKRPKNPIIIEGFPGFGLVGTISTEFLIDHLKTEQIGWVWFKELPAMVAIHEEKLVEPIGIFYSKKFNIVLFHVVTVSPGIEWKISEAILTVGKTLGAKEIVSIEGVGLVDQNKKDPETYFYSEERKTREKLKGMGMNPLKEGIIIGPTSAVLLRSSIKTTAFFAETRSNLPDSNAAAKIIQDLDKYLDLKVDYHPLLEQATEFEQKLKGILQQSKNAAELAERKKLSYVG